MSAGQVSHPRVALDEALDALHLIWCDDYSDGHHEELPYLNADPEGSALDLSCVVGDLFWDADHGDPIASAIVNELGRRLIELRVATYTLGVDQ